MVNGCYSVLTTLSYETIVNLEPNYWAIHHTNSYHTQRGNVCDQKNNPIEQYVMLRAALSPKNTCTCTQVQVCLGPKAALSMTIFQINGNLGS